MRKYRTYLAIRDIQSYNIYLFPLMVGVARRSYAAGKMYADLENSDMLKKVAEILLENPEKRSGQNARFRTAKYGRMSRRPILSGCLPQECAAFLHSLHIMENCMKKVILSSALASLLLLSAGQAPAAQDASYAKAYELYNIGKYAEVLRIIRPMAEAGSPDAQVLLGKCYENGLGVPQDGAQAVAWFRKAAEQGYAEGDLQMGYSYEVGFGVPQNMQEAVAWFRRAADKGLATAQYKLGVLYNEGRGVEKNAVEAVQWFQKSAAQGNPYAQRYLGACYEYGVGVEKDPAQAQLWYSRAAAQGVDKSDDVFVFRP